MERPCINFRKVVTSRKGEKKKRKKREIKSYLFLEHFIPKRETEIKDVSETNMTKS